MEGIYSCSSLSLGFILLGVILRLDSLMPLITCTYGNYYVTLVAGDLNGQVYIVN